MEAQQSKLDREMVAQKSKRDSLALQKQELNKRLTLNMVREKNLKAKFQIVVDGCNDTALQQIIDDANRMKQLEVI